MPTGVYLRKPPLERFMSFVRKSEGHWLWEGGRSGAYGAFWNGGWISPHVWSYKHFVGPIPKGHQIRHTCLEKLCVNFEHLITGTAKDNAADRSADGHTAHNRSTAKLTEGQVVELQRKYGQRKKFDHPTLAEIGKEYGISDTSVCWLLKGRTYREVVMPT